MQTNHYELIVYMKNMCVSAVESLFGGKGEMKRGSMDFCFLVLFCEGNIVQHQYNIYCTVLLLIQYTRRQVSTGIYYLYTVGIYRTYPPNVLPEYVFYEYVQYALQLEADSGSYGFGWQRILSRAWRLSIP